MPRVEWNEKNMKYAMCFFPLVGAVIGGLMLLVRFLCGRFGFNTSVYAVVMTALPVLVSGGIHTDGFIDTVDALSSYGDKEKKLEILKDPHTGAFAIIACCSYFLAAFGIWTEAKLLDIGILGIGFILSRTLSGFGVCKFPCAKKSGLAATFAEAADRKRCTIVLIIEMILCMAAMIWLDPLRGAFACAAAVLVCLGCRHLSMQKFGGITGDTQGFFLQVCELVMAFVVILIP